VDAVTKNRPGRRALEADAAFCAVVGIAAMALDRRLARQLGLPRHLVRMAGGASLTMSGVVVGMSRKKPVAPALATMAAVNVVGAAGFAVVGVRHPRPLGQLVFVGLALEIGAVAGIQAAALLQERKLARDADTSK